MQHLTKCGFASVLLTFFSITGTYAASVNEWRQEIDQIVDDIKLTHPDPFTKVGPLIFSRQAAALKAAIPTLSEEQRLVETMRLVALIGDGHTQLEPDSPVFDSWYPFRLYQFEDGYFITGAHTSASGLSGAQVLEIAGRPIEEVASEARELVGGDNAFDKKERIHVLSSAAIMKGLGYAKANGELKLKIKLANGQTKHRTLRPVKSTEGAPLAGATFDWHFFPEMKGPPIGSHDEWVGVFGDSYADYRKVDLSRPPHLTYRRLYVTRPMPEHDAYYIQVNVVGDASYENEDLAGTFKRAFKEMQAFTPKHLIVDLRYNFGGDGSRIPGVIHEFIKNEDNPPWTNLYILTGRRTFSAAIMALEGFTKHTRYTIVGEPSGAALNHYGDAVPIKHPQTGVQLYVSTLWHQLNEYDPGAWVYVDVPAPFTFKDYAKGRDPAVDAIVSGREMRAIPIIALSDGGAAARQTYKKRSNDFGKYDWWTPPAFEDIKRVGYDLLEDFDRPQDAVEMFMLLAELYPNKWNSWESLGRAQLAAGLKKEGLESFQCALAIEPNTNEDGDLRSAIAESEAPVAAATGCPVALQE